MVVDGGGGSSSSRFRENSSHQTMPQEQARPEYRAFWGMQVADRLTSWLWN